MLDERRRCVRGRSLKEEEDAVESVEEARLVAVVSTSPEWHLTGHTDHRWKGEEEEKEKKREGRTKGKRDKGRKTMEAEPG